LSKAWLIGGGLFIAVLVVASVVVAIVSSEDALSADTPEGRVQLFLSALDDGDLELAYESLSEEIQEGCPLSKVFGQVPDIESRLGGGRVTLEGTTTVGDTAFVDVRVTRIESEHPSGPADVLLGPSIFSHVQRYALRRELGDWRLVEYPWPLPACELKAGALSMPSADR